jgi:hypothetical protein
MTLIVDLDELDRVRAYLKTINDADLAEIKWVRGGQTVHIHPLSVEDWKFCGLNNVDFYGIGELLGWQGTED